MSVLSSQEIVFRGIVAKPFGSKGFATRANPREKGFCRYGFRRGWGVRPLLETTNLKKAPIYREKLAPENYFRITLLTDDNYR